jgi:chromosome partitioning protein
MLSRSKMKDADATRQQPRTIAVASAKGGSGKSSITAALAVQAVREGDRVALLDGEPQGSLTLWWLMRGKPENPLLIREDIEPSTARRRLAGEYDWLFLDTAPAMMDQVELAVEAADFVLVPLQASAFDLMAARTIISLCGEHKKAFAFVLNKENARRQGLNTSAETHLCSLGVILTERIQDRTVNVSALNKGRTGPEHPDARQAKEAREEIAAVWSAVKRLAMKARAWAERWFLQMRMETSSRRSRSTLPSQLKMSRPRSAASSSGSRSPRRAENVVVSPSKTVDMEPH